MKGKIIFAGVIGAMAGAVVSFLITRNHYEKIINDRVKEETESIKERYDAVYGQKDVEKEDQKENITDKTEELIDGEVPEVIRYAKKINEEKKPVDYTQYYQLIKKRNDEEKEALIPNIHSIDYLEFEENDDYGSACIYAYADGIFADDDNNIIENVEERIGQNPLSHIDEFDTGDMCYFVNDNLKMYYEVYRSEENYYGDVIADGDD